MAKIPFDSSTVNRDSKIMKIALQNIRAAIDKVNKPGNDIPNCVGIIAWNLNEIEEDLDEIIELTENY